MGVFSYLHRKLFGARTPTGDERVAADMENVVRDNDAAFKNMEHARKQTAVVTEKLARTVERVRKGRSGGGRNPFSDLEDLTRLQSVERQGHDYL